MACLNSPLKRGIKVQMPPTVKFLLKIAQVVKSSYVIHFWDKTCRLLVIQNLSYKIMMSCKGFVLKL